MEETDYFVPQNTKSRKISISCSNVKKFSLDIYKYIKRTVFDIHDYEELYDLEIDDNGIRP